MGLKTVRGSLVLALITWASILRAIQEGGQPKQGDELPEIDNVQMALDLLCTELVQEEIELSDNQNNAIRPLGKLLARAIQGGMNDYLHLSAEDREERNAYDELEKVVVPFRVEVKQILLPVQRGRLSEIMFQVCGLSVFEEPEVAADLELSNEQRNAIKGIEDGRFAKVCALLADSGLDTPQGVSDEWLARMQELSQKEHAVDKAAFGRVVEILTPEQRKQLKRMTGRDIDLEKLDKQRLENRYRAP